MTGSIRDPDTVLLGRFDRRGTLRYTGRTHPLNPTQRAELAAMLSPFARCRAAAQRCTPGRSHCHRPGPGNWTGPNHCHMYRWTPSRLSRSTPTWPSEHQRRRHRVRYIRARPDMSIYDVPLLLGEKEGYFGET